MTVETLTPVKRKSGAPVGNRNSYKHGFYSKQKTPAVLALNSVRAALPGMPSIGPRSFVNENLLLIEKIDAVLAVLAPKMLIAQTHKDTLTWFRPSSSWSAPSRRLSDPSFSSKIPAVRFSFSPGICFVTPSASSGSVVCATPPSPLPRFEQFCADPSSTTYSFFNNYIFHPGGAKGIDPRFYF